MGNIYLTAAEAALYTNNQAKAAEYVNVIRKRAALANREMAMTVTPSQVTVDFLLKERAGEHWRWYDLKRMGKLTKQYFQSTNQVVSVDFTDGT